MLFYPKYEGTLRHKIQYNNPMFSTHGVAVAQQCCRPIMRLWAL